MVSSIASSIRVYSSKTASTSFIVEVALSVNSLADLAAWFASLAACRADAAALFAAVAAVLAIVAAEEASSDNFDIGASTNSPLSMAGRLFRPATVSTVLRFAMSWLLANRFDVISFINDSFSVSVIVYMFLTLKISANIHISIQSLSKKPL